MRLEAPGWLRVEAVVWTDRVETVYNVAVEDDHTDFVGDDEWGWAAWAHNACHLNTNGSTSRFGLYEIYVNGTLHKVGKADLNRITKFTGLPTRLHQQIRKLSEIHGERNVTYALTDLGVTTTKAAKVAETARLWEIFKQFGIVPLGNQKSFRPV